MENITMKKSAQYFIDGDEVGIDKVKGILLEEVEKQLKENKGYELIYIDYNDNFNDDPKTLQGLILHDDKTMDSIYCRWAEDAEWEGMREIRNLNKDYALSLSDECKDIYLELIKEDLDFRQDVTDLIYDYSGGDYIKDLISHTRTFLYGYELMEQEPYDCNSICLDLYDNPSENISKIYKALGLKRTPEITNKLKELIANHYSHMAQLCFMWTDDNHSYWRENIMKLDNENKNGTITVNNKLHLFLRDTWNGCYSDVSIELDAPLKFSFDKSKLFIDEVDKYSVTECGGLSLDYYEDSIVSLI